MLKVQQIHQQVHEVLTRSIAIEENKKERKRAEKQDKEMLARVRYLGSLMEDIRDLRSDQFYELRENLEEMLFNFRSDV